MVELWINYWSGDFFVGTFESKEAAEKHYNGHKGRYRDYRGEKHGFPYGTPIYIEHEGKDGTTNKKSH